MKFEAGTPDYIATHGLATALDYVTSLGMDNILAHEQDLTRYALQQLREIEGMHIYGHRNDSGDAVISFNVGDIHHMDLGTLLDQLGIAVRTGHHCAQPLMDHLWYPWYCFVPPSDYYNTREEVDALVAGIKRIAMMF